MRVGTGGMWLALARQIVLAVELSKSRREQYQLDAHEEIFNAAVCNTKDAMVELVATLTSTLGMISYERAASSQAAGGGRRLLAKWRPPRSNSGARSFEVDTRSVAEATLLL